MTDWTELTDAGLLPGQPATSAQGLALRDNPVAIAEGAEDAPKVQGQALDVYKGGAVLTDGTAEEFTGLDRAKIIFVSGVITGTSGTPTVFQISVSDDDGATWGSWESITGSSSSNAAAFDVHIDLETGDTLVRSNVPALPAVTYSAGTITVPTNVNAVRFRRNGGTPSTTGFSMTLMGGVSP